MFSRPHTFPDQNDRQAGWSILNRSHEITQVCQITVNVLTLPLVVRRKVFDP
jgi:hypothetical protein